MGVDVVFRVQDSMARRGLAPFGARPPGTGRRMTSSCIRCRNTHFGSLDGVSSNGMFLSDRGDASQPVLLLIHGGGVAGWMWDAQIAYFGSRYRILVPDLPGHDRSSAIPFTTSAAVVSELAAHLEHLPAGTDITVVGFSFGAQVALELASSRPDLVARVVVTSALTEGIPLPRLSNWLVGLTAPLARRTWFAKLQAKSLFIPDNLLNDYIRTSKTLPKDSLVALTSANAQFRTPSTWRQFTGPALLLAGAKEPRAVQRAMRQLHHDNPRSELVIHDRAGHGLPLQYPEWFNTHVDDWIKAAA
ncbi:alpha/beta fold hydrolase [Nocardia grenadensis]|uniref:alpha/beta fold hydrolase n=1 Tax=Nocardia grenadensis TaxID=931537 RepID=UPI003D75E869